MLPAKSRRPTAQASVVEQFQPYRSGGSYSQQQFVVSSQPVHRLQQSVCSTPPVKQPLLRPAAGVLELNRHSRSRQGMHGGASAQFRLPGGQTGKPATSHPARRGRCR